MAVTDRLFDNPELQATLRRDPQKNIFLKLGAAIDVGASRDGRYVFVSHERTNKISLIDVHTGATLQELGLTFKDGKLCR
jgi:hypothetical protein